jgi:arginyl-tRNA synthetase
MQTLAQQLEIAFKNAIRDAFGVEADPHITASQNEKFGDYQSNAAMGLSKVLSENTGQKTNPRAVAEAIVAKLKLDDISAEKPSIAGPGFINVKLSATFLAQQLARLAGDACIGVAKVEKPVRVVVDYSAPNIAKEMHVGHLRSTIIGDAIARVLDFEGHDVIRQNHIGDWGTQFGKVILAIWHICMAAHRKDPDYPARTGKALAAAKKNDAERKQIVEAIARQQQQSLDEDVDGTRVFMPFLQTYKPSLEELLPAYQFVTALEETPEAEQLKLRGRRGETSLAELSKSVTADLQRGDTTDPYNRQERLAWEKVRAATLSACQEIYNQLGVLLTESDEYGESRYHPMLAAVVSDLRKLGLAVESDGAVAVFIDGPEKPPLVIEKSGEGGYLYATTDLAAIRYRVGTLGAKRVIYLVDARQSHHFNQVFATAKKAGWTNDASLEHAPFGTMLGEDNKPFKTRSGDTVKLKDLLDEAEERALKVVQEKNSDLSDSQKQQIARAVGIGAVKYADLSKDRNSDYVFSWDKMLAMDGNTAPYLQYAHARVRSIFRKAGVTGEGLNVQQLQTPQEQSLAKHILRFGEVVESVARDLKPHVLCNYLYELATRFSSFYENCPVLQSEEPVKSSRLALSNLTAKTLAKGLDLLGIEHPEQM